MIDPTEADIGRAVVYQSKRRRDLPPEEGVIIGVSSKFVFVRFARAAKVARSIKRADLEWKNDQPDPPKAA